MQPVLGRALTADDDRDAGRAPGGGTELRVLAAALRRVDPSILNQVITINSTPMTIVGVAPRGFAGIVSDSRRPISSCR